MEIKNTILFYIFFLFCFSFIRAEAETIQTSDLFVWNSFKGSAEDNKPANARKPNEIFTDPLVLELVEAVIRGKVRRIDELVARGVDVNAKGWNGLTPIFLAIRDKNKKGLEALLKAGANPNDTSNVFGRAAIHQASMKIDDPEFLELILKHGGDPNLPEVHGFCDLPLSMAFFGSNNVEAAKRKIHILLDAGADINRVNTSCDLAKTIAKPATILMDSIPKFDVAYFLLELGADPYLAAPDGSTFLTDLEYVKKMTLTNKQEQWKRRVLEKLKNDKLQ